MLPEDSIDDKHQELGQFYAQLDISASQAAQNTKVVASDEKEETSVLEPEVNLFKHFEDTTGGTSGIDIEAAVGDIQNQERSLNEKPVPNQDSVELPDQYDENFDE